MRNFVEAQPRVGQSSVQFFIFLEPVAFHSVDIARWKKAT